MGLPESVVTLVPTGQQKAYEIYPTMKEPHAELEISVGKQDTGHWFCKSQRFVVLEVHPQPTNPNAPYPFYRVFSDEKPVLANEVNTGPARPEARGYEYKATFRFEDKTELDPHIRITP
jgi:hypothetical protein